jgi:hypothetical protein
MSEIEQFDEVDDDLDGARPKRPWWARWWALVILVVVLAVGISAIFHTPGATTFGAVLLGAVILRTGWFFLQSFATPLPPPPDPGTLRKVKLVYRCEICGTEVRMTAATTEQPEAPRHCMDDMVLITPLD